MYILSRSEEFSEQDLVKFKVIKINYFTRIKTFINSNLLKFLGCNI